MDDLQRYKWQLQDALRIFSAGLASEENARRVTTIIEHIIRYLIDCKVDTASLETQLAATLSFTQKIEIVLEFLERFFMTRVFKLTPSPLLGRAAQKESHERVLLFTQPNDETVFPCVETILAEFDYDFIHPNQLLSDQAHLTQIWNAICNVKLIIADISNRKDEIYFMLGLAHVLGKPTIMLMNTTDGGDGNAPFDLRAYHTIKYTMGIIGENDLKEALRNKLKAMSKQILNHQLEIRGNTITLQKEPLWGLPLEDNEYKTDVFVALSFRPEFIAIYRQHILTLLTQREKTTKIGDDYSNRYSIMQQIWSNIYHAPIFIAECTGRNPNVFYEIGMALAAGKIAFILTQEPNDVPESLRTQGRYIFYKDTPNGRERLEQQLAKGLDHL